MSNREAPIPMGIALVILSALVGFLSVMCYKQGVEMEKMENAPRHFCDGSTTMGYAVPGTPEAAACWIEGGKK